MQKKKSTRHEFLSHFLGGGRVDGIFDKVEGVDMTGDYTGIFSVGSELADVRIEANDTIQVTMPAPLPEHRAAALKINHSLPGNARFALHGRESRLIANTQVNGKAHLPNTFRLIEAAFSQARGVNLQDSKPSETAMSKEYVREVLAQIEWGEGAVVEEDNSFELRPRVRGEVLPVHLVSEGNAIRLQRPVVNIPSPKKTAAVALCNLALRLNSQLRHARLAEHDGILVCESQLHNDLIRTPWVSDTAYAVAVAWRHVQLLLRIVAEQESVADSYVQMFCGETEHTALCDVSRSYR